MKFVIFQSSNTQRVTVNIQENEVLLNKEFRKSSEEDWRIGKGITLPKDKLVLLGDILSGKVTDLSDLETKEE